jgi:hypothetical protein
VHLIGKKPSCLHGRLVAVVKVSSDQKRLHSLFQAEFNSPHECATGRIPNQFGEVWIAESQGLQRRVKVDICSVNKSVRH